MHAPENSEAQAVWATIHRHLQAIFSRDAETYRATTADELSLYEWFVAPHRMDGLDFHLFMIENNWSKAEGNFRYDLWEPRLQLYGDTAVASYTFMLTLSTPKGITQQSHNESRVLIKGSDGWRVVHVHKSPAWPAPYSPAGSVY
jgi:ketosteroid isomerase-like protein